VTDDQELESNGKRRQPTIVDVAEAAGVAVGTVSRYLNGMPVRRANRAQIEEAVVRLRYKRSAVAAAMKTDLTHIVGLMVPVFNEFHSELLEQLSISIRNTGRALLTYCHGAEPKLMKEALDFFAAQRIDALIMSGVEELYEQVDELIGEGTPVVFYNNDIRGLPADRVFVDNRAVTQRAVTHLIDLGHRRIAILSGNHRDSSGIERFEGYAAALAEHSIALEPAYVAPGNWSVDGGHNALAHLLELKQPPTAVIAASYPMAIGALGLLKEQGKRVPEDLSLISFDDVPLFRLHEAGITAIAQPLHKIADSITSALQARLSDTDDERPRTVTLNCDIILRGSTRRVT
jgi:LacI family transcriptional regulator